jgi:ABC-2 type transport system ATP-binding protein
LDILKAENISKRYGGHLALDQVSISIPQQSIFGLLGPNGAGKTSLIRIITQITAPDQGEVIFNGEKLSEKHSELTGYLPEERGLYKKMKVGEQLIFLARLKGLSLNESKQRTEYWLEKLDLHSWKNHFVEDLSKGMQQKVQFISAVIHNPSLIILDEPFTGFDPINAELVKNEIINLKNQGSTIILSTHRMESIEELCTHIALINKSKKILDGPISEIKDQFKNSVFIVEGEGVVQDTDLYKVVEEVNLGKLKRYKIKGFVAGKENDILRKLMETISIQLFKEEVPSIQDIFISKVKQ